MGTKTVDEAVDANGTEAKSDKETVNVTKTDEAPDAEVVDEQDAIEDEAEDLDAEDLEGDDVPEAEKDASGVGLGAAAVVSAGLGIVSLTGSWVATVAAARENLIGQMENQSSTNVSTLVNEAYVDGWHVTALWGGLFALVSLIVGVVVLVRPAFGTPGRPQAAWIKSVAWAGVSLGVIGLLIAILKYTDVLLGMPSVS